MTEPMSNVDPKVILNANYGTTNNIEHEDSSKILSETLFYIADILKDHCGPYGKFALINNDANSEPIFTKDGINIVKSIDFASPIQTFIKNQMVYIGSRIESKIGDGTTSSMIIFASALGKFIKRVSESGKRYSYNEILEASKIFLRNIEKAYETVPISLNDFSEEDRIKAIKFIARNQALTSSHGDEEIAKAIEEAFSIIPEGVFGHITIDKEGFETDKRISLHIDESQYSVDKVSILLDSMLNTDTKTWYKAKNIMTYVATVPLADGDPTTARIIEAVEQAVKDNTPLAVLLPSGSSGTHMQQLCTLFNTNPDHKVVVFEFPFHTKEDYSKSILLLSGRPYSNGTNVFNFDIYFKDHKLAINGIYDNPTNSVIHPFYGNKKDYKDYNEYIETLDALIAKQKAAPISEATTKFINSTTKQRNAMYLTKRATILIGGNAYDSAAAVDVVVDCTLAVKSSLINGFVFGGNRTLHKTITDEFLRPDVSNSKNNIDELIVDLAMSFTSAIHEVALATYPTTESANKAISDSDMTSNVLHLDDPSYSYEDIRSGKNLDISNVIIQPSTTDIELIKRFIEVGLKFVNVARIISSSGYYIREAKNR